MTRTIFIVILSLSAGTMNLMLAHAEGDSSLAIEQVPQNREPSDSAGQFDVLPEGVPERCADPQVAASDPKCYPEDPSQRARGGIPVIDGPKATDLKLIPGVTINQSRSR